MAEDGAQGIRTTAADPAGSPLRFALPAATGTTTTERGVSPGFEPAIRLSGPQLSDAAAMWSLAGATGLDVNAPYAYMIVCRDFAGTSLVAHVEGDDQAAGDLYEPAATRAAPAGVAGDAGAAHALDVVGHDGRSAGDFHAPFGTDADLGGSSLAGFVSGYLRPQAPDTLFVWQVAVHPRYRRRHVALAMVRTLWLRHAPAGLRFVEATVAASNEASDRLFRSFAEVVGAPLVRSAMFDAALFPVDHDGELLYRIGPLPARLAVSTAAPPERTH